MPKKILLADDSITIQKVIGLTFANEDVLLTVVDNGDEAIIKAKEVIPDLIIADVVMPGKDGYEVCYSSKNDPSLAHVPVLLLTGTFETFDETMAKKVGADGFITKPFESQALIDKVNELIGSAAQRRAGLSVAELPAETPSFDTGLEAGAELFDSVEPLEAIEPVEDIAPLEDFTPVDDVAPLEDIAPVEELAPMEFDEVTETAPEPVEEDPMAGFGHLAPDPEETSFADISLEEAPAAQAVSHDDLLPEAGGDMLDMAAEPVIEPVAETGLVEPPAEQVENGAAGEDGNWNLSDFNDYMAEKRVAEAPAAAIENDLPSPVEPTLPVETAAFEEPALTAAEEPVADLAADSYDSADGFDGSGSLDKSDGFAIADAFGAADSFSAEEPAAEELGAPEEEIATTTGYDAADDFGANGNFGALDDDLPASLEEETEPAPAPRPALTSVDLSPDDGELELTPVAPQPDMPLEQVADMYSLDEAPLTMEAAESEADTAVGTAIEPPMTDEFPDEEPQELAASPFATSLVPEPPLTAAVAVATPAAAPAPLAAFDTAALEQQLGRLPELIEGRVKSMLDNDALLSSLGDKTSKMVEAKIEEAIRKVAPDIIEQLVKKALADATERILNETIGRLRNG